MTASESKIQPRPLLFQYRDIQTIWSSPENFNGDKGAGGKENHGAKGRASVPLAPGESANLLDWEGMGIVTRMWLTVSDRSPEMLRSLRIDMYWDRESTPAVSAPLGDFFGVGLGRTAAFESEFFANPEGRSFNCFIPMPFRKHGRITVTNESRTRLEALYFDVNLLALKEWSDDYLYFHSHWRRDQKTALAKDFELLPRVMGKGRYLGVNIGVNTNLAYGESWWGEGEVKVFLDGDTDLPTLAGTGTEDYIGTGWGQGQYATRYVGSPVADAAKKQWAFYRYHVPDPVFFSTDIRVTIQQMGGGDLELVASIQNEGAPMMPVTISAKGEIFHVYNPDGPPLDLDEMIGRHEKAWANYYRSDDVSATVYFYLDKPRNDLPELAPVTERTSNLRAS